MGKDIQDYLDKGLYGSPQLKPDEQRKFLGTFRERVVFILSLSDLTSASYENFAISQFQKYPGGTLLVNALLKPAIQKQLIHLTQTNHVSLKLVDTENTLLADQAIVVVYTLNHAVNKENIELPLQTKFSNTTRDIKKAPTTTKSESFFKSLFSKK
ncbi:DUF1694 domain-containing protein [Vagococcus bubulae]|uniref:DUF1694 domain-containing protein n=1 Tax=Vagococcus bubulae TaxID=1977868 RepID=A0A429ZN03_9ENTE|nr:DUF1694 domain-containing protein [Vagococcus bubulae]RST95063.1 hypothetical protein CBF36_04115 [Vagococcus bubulae]